MVSNLNTLASVQALVKKKSMIFIKVLAVSILFYLGANIMFAIKVTYNWLLVNFKGKLGFSCGILAIVKSKNITKVYALYMYFDD